VSRYSWGPKRVAIGLGLALGVFVLTNVILVVIVIAAGIGTSSEDVGDTFVKMVEIGKYADQRLQQAAQGNKLAGPPEILADLVTLKLGLASTLVYDSLLIVIAGGTARVTFRDALALFKLDQYDWRGVWRPFVAVFLCYVAIAVYAVAAEATGIGLLKPNSTLPSAVLRDDLALAAAGVLAVLCAPIAEEAFFRGFVFGGLTRWGFWPAALLSGALFAGVHFDPGSVIPFLGIGIVLSWLFWVRGCLWDSIIFHTLFNGTSFAILLATR
jgi:membrane protease YdiL (CAAX protease family)